MRRAQLEHHLVLRPEVDLLHVLARREVPDVQPVAVLVAEQQLADEAVLDHVRRPPLGRDHRAEVEVPPEVVGELLRPAVGLPLALDREVLVVEQEDAAGPVAVGVAERGDVDAVGAAVDGVRAAVAGLARDLLGLDDLDELGLPRVILDVDDVDAGGAQAGDEQDPAGRADRLGAQRHAFRGGSTPALIRRRALSAWSRTWSAPRRRETSGSPPGSGSPSCPGP